MLFAAIYDGTWDQYIDDFAAGVAAGSLQFLDVLWENLEGYPGLKSPDVKDYLSSTRFRSVTSGPLSLTQPSNET